MKFIYNIFILLSVVVVKAQSFAPAAGFETSTAIYKDSAVFVNWASGVTINRGLKDIQNPANGYVTYGSDAAVMAKADASIVSLGDGGTAIVSFDNPIVNGEGVDFAVFENGFFENDTSALAFLEFAFVEVSTDGITYIRFPAVSELQTELQIGGFQNTDARYIHNLAGKYTQFYGTPFDLEDLKTSSVGTTVNLNEINYIKIIDVVGIIDSEYTSFDSIDNQINDPYPTPYASGGFDLDAVGVIHDTSNTVREDIVIFPNPVGDFLHFKTAITPVKQVLVFSTQGKLLLATNLVNNIDVGFLTNGVYILKVYTDKQVFTTCFLK